MVFVHIVVFDILSQARIAINFENTFDLLESIVNCDGVMIRIRDVSYKDCLSFGDILPFSACLPLR